MRLTSCTAGRILNALCTGNRKPLLRFMRKLMADRKPNRRWTDVEFLLLKSIISFCMENGFVRDGQDLIKIAGWELLLVLPDSAFQTAVTIVEKAEEHFILEVFSAIAQCGRLSKLSPEESKLLLTAAEKALALGKTKIALGIYKAALAHDVVLSELWNPHPLLHAARTHNPVLGEAFEECFSHHLKYNTYDEGLEELVLFGDARYVRILLRCGANVHVPGGTGKSLLELAPNEQVYNLLVEYGAQPTDQRIYLLRQAILSIKENGNVDHNILKEIFAESEPLLRYAFYPQTYPTPFKTEWDLVLTAARHRCADALSYMIPHLQTLDDKALIKFLEVLFGVDTLAQTLRNEQTAQEIIQVLELLDQNGIRLADGWDPDNEVYQMTLGYSSKVAPILSSVYHRLHGNFHYPDESLVKMQELLWRIGGVENTVGGARDLMILGLTHRKMCFLEKDTGYDFALLDTDQSSSCWMAVWLGYSHHDLTREFLDYVMDHGGNIHHQATADGMSCLHAAYFYGRSTDAVKLLLEAGADPKLRDRFERKPRNMPRQKMKLTSKGITFP